MYRLVETGSIILIKNKFSVHRRYHTCNINEIRGGSKMLQRHEQNIIREILQDIILNTPS